MESHNQNSVSHPISSHFRFCKVNLLAVVDRIEGDLSYRDGRGSPFSPLQQGWMDGLILTYFNLVCCCCLPLLPGLACSIHTTWGHLLSELCRKRGFSALDLQTSYELSKSKISCHQPSNTLRFASLQATSDSGWYSFLPEQPVVQSRPPPARSSSASQRPSVAAPMTWYNG